MHGHTLFARALMAVVLFLVAAGVVSALVSYALGRTAALENRDGLSHISLAGTPIFVRIADTPALEQQGLSGTASLPSDQGMLFMFDHDDYYQMWMKDMRYPLDIVWLTDQGIVVHMEKDISPETYPKTFTSDQPARMVLELPAGFLDRHGVEIGSRATIY